MYKICNMKNLAINPKLISDNNTFNFKKVPTMYEGFYDVFYKGQRIAILNGTSAPLQWTAKNGSNVPIKVIDQLEEMVIKMIKQTYTMQTKVNLENVRFNGSDYNPKTDNARLSGQIQRIFNLMKDQKWRTLSEIEGVTKDPQASISAQLRNLRKERYGSHVVEKINIGDPERGLFAYKLVPNN
jgi:hypothetical protein